MGRLNLLLVEVLLVLEVVLSLVLEALFLSFLVDDSVRHAQSFQAVRAQAFLLQLFPVQVSSQSVLLGVPPTHIGRHHLLHLATRRLGRFYLGLSVSREPFL